MPDAARRRRANAVAVPCRVGCSRSELARIDAALTATYDEKKNRWFAPLEIEWDGYRQVTQQIRASSEMQELYKRFADEAARAVDRVWASGQ